MRKFSLPLALATVLVASVAFADRPVTAEFTPLAASGISGDVKLQSMVQGGTKIQVQLKDLQPNTEYTASIFLAPDGTCTSGVGTVIATFTSKQNGIANFHVDLSQELSTIGSVGVRLSSDPAVVQACADLP